MEKLILRPAVNSDADSILRLIRELAAFEKLDLPDADAEYRLLDDAFSQNPSFKILVADTGSEVVGYAIYFFTYSSFLAKKTLYLEDIFVTELFRARGIGKLFFNEIKRIAEQNGCGRMEWMVLNWNKNAINFYDNIGAKQMKGWQLYRLDI